MYYQETSGLFLHPLRILTVLRYLLEKYLKIEDVTFDRRYADLSMVRRYRSCSWRFDAALNPDAGRAATPLDMAPIRAPITFYPQEASSFPSPLHSSELAERARSSSTSPIES
jgi:hypothetical protein